MRRDMLRSSFALVAVLGAAVTVGCAHGRQPGSYLPVGASAWYSDSTDDGVTLTLPGDAGAAVDAVSRALRATGYEVEQPTRARHGLRTAARRLGSDTTLVISAQVIPLGLPEPSSSLVLTATYSVPSRRLHAAPVLQRSGESNPLYGRLREVADTLRRSLAPAP